MSHQRQDIQEEQFSKPDKPGVSVTWKWLAVTMCGVVIAGAGFDRTSFDTRLSVLEQRQAISPTKDDIKDLRAAIDNLSVRIDSLNDGRSPAYRSPRQQGQP